MAECVLFIDGENFLRGIGAVLKAAGISNHRDDLAVINLEQLFKEPLRGLDISGKIFYVAKIHLHSDTADKSKALIGFQRKLRNNLIKQGYEFVMAGNVRAQKVGAKTVFREKGVDVKIAVDLVSLACDKKIDTAIVCSSDSDLQPAIKELRKRGVEVVYLGFESSPNKGLTYTTNRTILLRDPEVTKAFQVSVGK
ncbi:MAG: NYN domain-containing protein [Patescibacteria group bacterium]